ncbi:hypothetical protein [Absidia glauca]|uniref:Uncharacterized protein n=1 Tax=Absidia glauca TaxID=4829 RepID=A0A168NVC3_ABSGL|nr:hypothetical protein [Absidia glauca]
MPVTTTSLLSWGATLGAAASAAYVNRRNSQDNLFILHRKDDSSTQSSSSSSPRSSKGTYHAVSKNSDIQTLTFVLGND